MGKDVDVTRIKGCYGCERLPEMPRRAGTAPPAHLGYPRFFFAAPTPAPVRSSLPFVERWVRPDPCTVYIPLGWTSLYQRLLFKPANWGEIVPI